MKNPFKKIPWKKVGSATLAVAGGLVPGGSAVGTAIQVIKEVRRAEEAALPGSGKKAMVLDRLQHVTAASAEIAAAVDALIEAYVAVMKAWDALRTAVTKVRGR